LKAGPEVKHFWVECVTLDREGNKSDS
jgi:hypothetical protein